MGERKVASKYFPPDFDPSKVPRKSKPGGSKTQEHALNQQKIRTMLPFTVRCSTCGTFLYAGSKFNARKEDVPADSYIGIKVYRFYLRCTRCSSEFTLKTDPQNADYICEAGATRSHDPSLRGSLRQTVDAAPQPDGTEEEELPPDAMVAAEQRAADTKREFDTMNALDELMSMNARATAVTSDMAIQAMHGAEDGAAGAKDGGATALGDDGVHPDDERALQAMLARQRANVRRLRDDDDEGGGGGGGGGGEGNNKRMRSETTAAAATTMMAPAVPLEKQQVQLRPVVAVVKRKVESAAKPKEEGVGSLALLGAYSDDSDDD